MQQPRHISRLATVTSVLVLCLCSCGMPANRPFDDAASTLPKQATSTTPNTADIVDTDAPTDTNSATPSVCPPAGGNEKGVGAPCTKGGSECDGTPSTYCTVNYTTLEAPFCTRGCQTGADCGSGASCIASPTNKSFFVCLPNACVPHDYPTDVKGPVPSSCLPPKGNSLGLGRPCGGNLPACITTGKGLQLCTSTVLSSTPLDFCTTLCKQDSDCGEAMRCAPAPGITQLVVCIPDACLP